MNRFFIGWSLATIFFIIGTIIGLSGCAITNINDEFYRECRWDGPKKICTLEPIPEPPMSRPGRDIRR